MDSRSCSTCSPLRAHCLNVAGVVTSDDQDGKPKLSPKLFDYSVRENDRLGFIRRAGSMTRTIMTQTLHKTAAMIDRYYRKEELFTDNANSYTGL